jgi:signal transduction histidine kinase
LPHAAADIFAEPERFEREGSGDAAVARYRSLARSSDPSVRAGALRRIARIHWRERRFDNALDTYRALAELRDVSDLDMPADLYARRSICDVFHATGNRTELERCAARLEQDLFASTWSIDRETWELAIDNLESWRDAPIVIPQERQVFTVLGDMLWREFRGRDGAFSESASRLIDVAGTPVTLFSSTSGAQVSVIAALPAALEAWSTAAVRGAIADDARLALLAPAGTALAGTAAPVGTPVVSIRSSDSGLPWNLSLHSDKWVHAGEQFAYRRRLLLGGLASILLLLLGGSYFLWRVVQRELAISRLQTDFVAAVSHEFRTPLTSLRHVTELLDEDDQMPADRRRSFYDVYRRNIDRLHQLVESLLDFARMEAGRKPYEQQPLDAADLATHVVAEFKRQGTAARPRIDLDVSAAAGLQLRGDREALANALRNLLDNAVKYSPEGQPIHVVVAAHSEGVSFAVCDHGLGIARHEQQAIFHRFVRGKQAIALGIKGTGLGLAMVAHIAHAHDGTVEVESEEGKGSTFRLILPASVVSSDAAPHYELA